MKKVYIVAQEEPENCHECRFFANPCIREYCFLTDKPIGAKEAQKKPKWCPLKPMPEKPDYPPIGAESFVAGWNACIDRVFGGGESDERS